MKNNLNYLTREHGIAAQCSLPTTALRVALGPFLLTRSLLRLSTLRSTIRRHTPASPVTRQVHTGLLTLAAMRLTQLMATGPLTTAAVLVRAFDSNCMDWI